MRAPVRIVIQCRLSSARLPAKALLPIGAYSLLELCALRAGNTGREVYIATSDESSDDAIEAVARKLGIKCIRNSLNDVLARFISAVSDLPDNAICVRLTADNVFPDGAFIDELVNRLEAEGLKYLGTSSPRDGLPYGLSAEACLVGELRRAHKEATLPFDREHVTPLLRRWNRSVPFRPKSAIGDGSGLRCTVDTFEDYLRICSVLNTASDPLKKSWSDLWRLLMDHEGVTSFRIPFREVQGGYHSQLTLGTVQLGMGYGIANQTGQPTLDESRRIINVAARYGVDTLDSAQAYGESEARLGTFSRRGTLAGFRVITKLAPKLVAESAREAAVETEFRVLKSCMTLGVDRLDGVLLHNWSHYSDHNCAVWAKLVELKRSGLITRIGASVYDVEAALTALSDPELQILQIPFNILDHRWLNEKFQKKRAERQDLWIHARSPLLQGVLAASEISWPKIEGVDAKSWCDRLEALRKRLSRLSVLDLCFAYVRSQGWITSIVAGFEREDQLRQALNAFESPALTTDECRLCESELAGAPTELLNPALWSRKG